MISEEWCILDRIKYGRRKYFSCQGDSGASIMGNDGRVAAMLTYSTQDDDQGSKQHRHSSHLVCDAHRVAVGGYSRTWV